MNIDMAALLRDHGVSTEGKHQEPGWLNVRCPFCDDRGNHLGWNVRGQYWNCYRCGGHRTDATLAELLGVSDVEAWAIARRYPLRPASIAEPDSGERTRPDQIVVPGADLVKMHLDYLRGRGYDPARLLPWQLSGTNHMAPGLEKFRIMCPIYYNGVIVSWQGRDISGKSPLRWYSCPQEKELREHKHCLGGSQLVPGDIVAVVEGFTDAWRLGPGAVCTFGTAYSAGQILLLSKYTRIFIVLDSEEKDSNAIKQAEELGHSLSTLSRETVLVELDHGDPGDLPQDDADALMRDFNIRR